MGGTIRLRPILSEHSGACVEVSGIAILFSSGDVVVDSSRFSGLCQRFRLQRPTVNSEKFLCCPHNLPNSLLVLNKELASTTGGFRI